MKGVFCAILALLAASSALTEAQEIGDERFVIAYAESDNTGPYEDFYDYTPDLSVALMDNTIRSLYYTGFWIFYDSANYVSDNGTVCFVHSIALHANMTDECIDMASSLRYAGSPYGLDDNYYNLYEGRFFQGTELRGNTDKTELGDLDQQVSSLVITGQSEWTIYTGPDFTGEAVCLIANALVENDGIVMQYSYFYQMSQLYLPDNSIRSLRRGCLSDRIVRMSLDDDVAGREIEDTYVTVY